MKINVKSFIIRLMYISVFILSTSCAKDGEVEGPKFENYFNLGLDYYTVNTNNIFWNQNLKALNVRSNQGAIIVITFNDKPVVSNKYNVVRPDDLSKNPLNCYITIITEGAGLEYWTSSGVIGSLFELQVAEQRIAVDFANVELITLRNGTAVKDVSNGKFFSR